MRGREEKREGKQESIGNDERMEYEGNKKGGEGREIEGKKSG